MTPLLFLVVSLAGGLGAALRLVVDTAVSARVRSVACAGVGLWWGLGA